MPAFLWKALDKEGETCKGTRDADSASSLRQHLRQSDLIPISVKEITQKNKSNQFSLSSLSASHLRKLSSRDLAILTRQLATLLQSGLPIDLALSTMVRQVKKSKSKNLLVAIRSKILEGHTFAQALEQYERVFPDYYIATVSAGEKSGSLPVVLERLSAYIQSSYMTKNKITLALIYPLFILVVGVSVVIALLAFVLPDILKVFDNLNHELPVMTQILIAINAFVQDWGLILLLMLLVVFIASKFMLQNESMRMRWHSLILKIPVYGRLLKEQGVSRFIRTLSILLESKVNITQSMQIASDVVALLPIKKRLQGASKKVQDGNSVNMSLSEVEYFEPILLSLIASGEQSGTLAEMLRQGAKNQEEDTQVTLSILVGIFEPVMILLMGAVVLFIVVAILVPIFDMNTLIR